MAKKPSPLDDDKSSTVEGPIKIVSSDHCLFNVNREGGGEVKL
jgi:hypothetical protein